MACCADLKSFDLVRKNPDARLRIFLRLARLLVPRFTRGKVCSFRDVLLNSRETGTCQALAASWKNKATGLLLGQHVTKHFSDFSLDDRRASQTALALGSLASEDVAIKRLVSLDLSAAGALHALRGSAMRLH